MHKFPMPIGHDVNSSGRKSKRLRTASIVLLGFLLAPVVAEGGWLCFAQWCQVMGTNTYAKTPIMDAMQDQMQSAHGSFWECMAHWFQNLPWDPRVVMSVGAVVMIIAIRMLKL